MLTSTGSKSHESTQKFHIGLGRLLAELRESRKMSRSQVARSLKYLTVNELARIEAGKQKEVTTTLFFDLITLYQGSWAMVEEVLRRELREAGLGLSNQPVRNIDVRCRHLGLRYHLPNLALANSALKTSAFEF